MTTLSKTVYVDPYTGDDSNDGSSEFPVETIKGGLAKLFTASTEYTFYLTPAEGGEYTTLERTMVLRYGIHAVTNHTFALDDDQDITCLFTLRSDFGAVIHIDSGCSRANGSALLNFVNTKCTTFKMINCCAFNEASLITMGVNFYAYGDASSNLYLINCSFVGFNYIGYVTTISSVYYTHFNVLSAINCCNGRSTYSVGKTARVVVTSELTSKCALGPSNTVIDGYYARPNVTNSAAGNGCFLPALTETGEADFSEWINDDEFSGGASLISTTSIIIDTRDGADKCRVLSPVYDLGSVTTLAQKYVAAIESTGDPGNNHVVDNTPLDATRTLEWRMSETTFGQTDVSPSWEEVERNGVDSLSGKYLQFRVTLIMNGA